MTTVRDSIVEALGAAGGYVSGQELGGRLGVSRAAVWKHIRALKRDGYSIESSHARGYRLREIPDRLERALSADGPHGIRTKWLGHRAVFKQSTGSTNSDALALGRQGAPHGTVVFCEEQRSGRGRMGRSWESARGVNLYLSILLRPSLVPAQAPQLSLVAGVAVAEALENLGVSARIKWPNDIVLRGRKLCGILTEIVAEADRVECVVVGIGINVNSAASDFSPDLRTKATSVRMTTGRTVDRGAFLRVLLGVFERVYGVFESSGFAGVAPQWRRRSYLEGRRVDVEGVGERLAGRCLGIDDDGALLVDTGGASPARVLAGDVSLQGAYL